MCDTQTRGKQMPGYDLFIISELHLSSTGTTYDTIQYIALSNTIFIFLFWDEQSDIWIYSKAWHYIFQHNSSLHLKTKKIQKER